VSSAKTPDQQLWREEELEVCPRCGTRTLTPKTVRLAAGFRYCLTCGMIPEPSGE
jgi:hypothetical protein